MMGLFGLGGENYCGSLGKGNDDSSISVPVKINAFNGVDIVDVKSGYANSMALGRSNLYYKYNRISAEWLID